MKFNCANLIQGSVFLFALSVTLLTACGGGGSATADTTAPTVNTLSPLAGASSVAVTATITATFNKAVTASSINATNFTLSDGTTNVTGEVSYDSASRTATFTPKSQLNYLKTYTATITTGVTDMAGNALQSDYFWKFTTVHKPVSQTIPNPILVFDYKESYVVNEKTHERYFFTVSNWSDFPNELFAASPELPPCGLNTSSSRTWVTVHDDKDLSLSGFCSLYSPNSLNGIWFAVPSETPPPSIYIVLNDRLTQTVYKSNVVTPK